MFGIYRTALAILVVLHHFSTLRAGGLAVTAFFVLSGFLMTLLIDTKYRERRMAFAANRFLRLYPTYWATMLLMTILLAVGLPASRSDIGIPSGGALIEDILYIASWNDDPQLILTAWAVTNEIIFYILIGLGLSATRRRTTIWLMLSVILTIGLKIFGSSELNYFSPLAASLPFAAGAFAYHFRRALADKWMATASLPALASMIALGYSHISYGGGVVQQILFIAASAVTSAGLFSLGKLTSPWQRKLDEAIGHASYPMYLNHYGAAMIVMALTTLPLTGKGTLIRSMETGLAVCAVSVALSVATYFLVDKWVNRLREKLRSPRYVTQPTPRHQFAR